MTFGIKDHARGFFKAAERCNEKRCSGPQKCEWLPLQAVVCWSFSIELGLKAMLADEGKENQCEHNLDSLFKNLKEETRTSIMDELKQFSNISCDEFNRLLKKNSGKFVEFRYIHEKITNHQATDANITFLAALSKAILKRITPPTGADQASA